MSLINEALKRAEADKLNRSPYFDNLTVLPVSADAGPPPPALPPEPKLAPQTMIHPQRRQHGRAATTLMLVAGIFACLAASTWYVWRVGGPPTAPQAALAAPDAAQRSSNSLPGSPDARPPQAPGGAEAAVTPAPAARKAPSRDIELTIAKTMQALHAVGTDANNASCPPAAHSQAADANEAGAAPSPPEAPKAPATAPSAPPASSPGAVYLDLSQFKLSGIVCGPDENVAIINGRPVRTGNMVNGARIMKIERDRVDLKIAGREFSLNL